MTVPGSPASARDTDRPPHRLAPPHARDEGVVNRQSDRRVGKRTDARRDALLAALRSGATRRAASSAVGIDHTTLYRWMVDAPELRFAVETAEAEAELAFTRVVMQAAISAGPRSWEAAAWWLERRH